jgi:hypothetical protein
LWDCVAVVLAGCVTDAGLDLVAQEDPAAAELAAGEDAPARELERGRDR